VRSESQSLKSCAVHALGLLLDCRSHKKPQLPFVDLSFHYLTTGSANNLAGISAGRHRVVCNRKKCTPCRVTNTVLLSVHAEILAQHDSRECSEDAVVNIIKSCIADKTNFQSTARYHIQTRIFSQFLDFRGDTLYHVLRHSL
jgi:hypothetical protein